MKKITMEEINKYVKESFVQSDKYDKCLQQITRLCNFIMQKVDGSIDSFNAILTDGLLENSTVKHNLSIIVKIIKEVQIDGNLEDYFKNNILILLITYYAAINNIDFDNNYQSDTDLEKKEYSGSDLAYVPKMTNEDSDTYGHMINRYREVPVLSYEELIDLMKKAQSGDINARNKIMYHNAKLVISIAKKYYNCGIDYPDLFQVGNIGLMKAIERFDIEKGLQFSTFAVWWIRQEITRTIANETRTIRVPVHVYERYQKIRKAQKHLENENGQTASIEEVADVLKETPQEVEKIIRYYEMTTPISINTPLYQDSEELLYESIPEDESCHVDTTNLEYLSQSLAETINEMSFTPRELEIINLRFGLNGQREHTLDEIGQKLNLTRERIRQLEDKLKRRLRNNPKIKALNNDYNHEGAKGMDLYSKSNKRKGIFKVLTSYSDKELYDIVAVLKEEYIDLLIKKYGKDLKENNSSNVTAAENKKIFYIIETVIPQTKETLRIINDDICDYLRETPKSIIGALECLSQSDYELFTKAYDDNLHKKAVELSLVEKRQLHEIITVKLIEALMNKTATKVQEQNHAKKSELKKSEEPKIWYLPESTPKQVRKAAEYRQIRSYAKKYNTIEIEELIKMPSFINLCKNLGTTLATKIALIYVLDESLNNISMKTLIEDLIYDKYEDAINANFTEIDAFLKEYARVLSLKDKYYRQVSGLRMMKY